MKKQRLKLRKAQTALEYIAASFVFATVGIGTFLLINRGSVLSTWDDSQEADLTGQAGQFWQENPGTEPGIELPEPGEALPSTPVELQNEFNDLTRQYLEQNQAGYGQEDLEHINQGVSGDWFISSSGE